MVEITSSGRAGRIRYQEPAGEHTFDWEFGAQNVVISIYVPTSDAWDAAIPWAAGRRGEVLTRMASEVRAKRCAGCGIEIADHWVNLTESGRERPALVRAVIYVVIATVALLIYLTWRAK